MSESQGEQPYIPAPSDASTINAVAIPTASASIVVHQYASEGQNSFLTSTHV